MWDLAGVYASMARSLNHQTTNHGKAAPEDFHAPKYTSVAAAFQARR
jgi:penicillin-binding protein 1C